MFQSIHASHNQLLYLAWMHDINDIADDVRDDRLETITSSDRQIVFWFTTHRTVQIINRPAAEMLVAATAFTARDVPLLRGSVVITGRDHNGDPAGLSDEQLSWLPNLELRGRDTRILDRRLARARRHRLAQSAAARL
ncbi:MULTISPECIES: hypothetical protein [Mycolicibacter]|uniref:Uncharacterized protein n=1 Tax=Mycolicibacter longobardus TaxID=1108812 RepID=A0A1X1YBT5_9MYCO|nr:MULTISPECIES: hypothetical protein [Mycolicibacter]ORW08539.1 hypothetical protein AWC16_19265 [Mycolicibacter longobardus]RAV04350.1 hypothetical protein DQP56_00595 [Mycolicibacter senuensis]